MEKAKIQLIDRILSFRKKSSQSLLPTYLRSKRRFTNTQTYQENQKKGTEFEQFVVRRFNPEHFALIEWRSDKTVDDIFPLMSKFPDLEFYFESKSESFHFAVECKWRDHFTNNYITLDKFQLENYRHYQQVTDTPTFIILGVGNNPRNPTNVYILSLSDVESEKFHEFNLEVFKRLSPYDNFFIDCKRKKLF